MTYVTPNFVVRHEGRERFFAEYDKACEFLDAVSPATATAGFLCTQLLSREGIMLVEHAAAVDGDRVLGRTF